VSFTDKAIENKIVAQKCLTLNAFNAGASRAYYSAFLAAKKFLIENHFDYKTFLNRIGEKQKEYSHGTIQRALIECLMANGKKPTDVYKLTVWDNLYKKRKRADYYPANISAVELRESLKELNTILSIL
jgi:uncharacterized protein (UPF0332 family)